MKKYFYLIALLTLQAFGGEYFLVEATNDEDNETAKLYLVLNEHKDVVGFKKKTFVNGDMLEQEAYSLDQESMVLERQKGRDILTLKSDNFASHQGGDLALDYLYNGIKNTIGTFSMDLYRDGDEWKLEAKGKNISHIHMVSNRIRFFGTVGIKHIKIVK